MSASKRALFLVTFGAVLWTVGLHAEDHRDLNTDDLLDMLGIDCAKVVLSGKPHRNLLVTIPYGMQVSKDPILLPFADGDKVELLIWNNPSEDRDQVKRIHYRWTNTDGSFYGEFSMKTTLVFRGKQIQLSPVHMFARTVGSFPATEVPVGFGFLYGADGEILDSPIYIQLK